MRIAGICLAAALFGCAFLALTGCSDDDPLDTPVVRFVDNEDGTVTDLNSGLVWLKNASCFVEANGSTGDWATARSWAAALANGQCGLTDGSSTGDWRLPDLECPDSNNDGNVEEECELDQASGEFFTILSVSCPAPYIADTAGTGCWSEGDLFLGVKLERYWSSTEYGLINAQAYVVRLGAGEDGEVDTLGKIITRANAWAVRDAR